MFDSKPTVKLAAFTDDELQDLLENIGKELKDRMKKRKKHARLEIRRLAKESDMSVSFLSGKRQKKSAGTLKP